MEVQQTELDYLIYNDPLGYADLILTNIRRTWPGAMG